GPFGAQCTCSPGFQLLNDSKTCDDIDECLIPGFCSQQCYNERGSFRCHCSNPHAAVLLVAKRSQIMANKLIMRPPVIYPVATGSGIVTVDFDRETSRIYWADATQKKIWSAFQNGTEKREVFSGGLMVPGTIAVDWVGRNLYWTDSVLENIEVLQHPHGMTIFEDSVYWSERYTSKVVSTNKFHGGNITVLFNNIYQPMGIVMDHPIKQPAGTYFKYAVITSSISLIKLMVWFLCLAINPCREHLCTQLCLLSTLRPRYYTCHCQSGWKLDSDQRTCIKGRFSTCNVIVQF
ncbi:hypothetical protein XENOCAPTIV_018967, partial [Xenoophorus captivus]